MMMVYLVLAVAYNINLTVVVVFGVIVVAEAMVDNEGFLILATHCVLYLGLLLGIHAAM